MKKLLLFLTLATIGCAKNYEELSIAEVQRIEEYKPGIHKTIISTRSGTSLARLDSVNIL